MHENSEQTPSLQPTKIVRTPSIFVIPVSPHKCHYIISLAEN